MENANPINHQINQWLTNQIFIHHWSRHLKRKSQISNTSPNFLFGFDKPHDMMDEFAPETDFCYSHTQGS